MKDNEYGFNHFENLLSEPPTALGYDTSLGSKLRKNERPNDPRTVTIYQSNEPPTTRPLNGPEGC